MDTGFGNVGEFDGVIFRSADGLRDVEADFFGIYLKSSHEFEIGDMIVTELYVHQTWNDVVIRGVLIILNAFDQRGSAVAQTGDCNAYFLVGQHGTPWTG